MTHQNLQGMLEQGRARHGLAIVGGSAPIGVFVQLERKVTDEKNHQKGAHLMHAIIPHVHIKDSGTVLEFQRKMLAY